MIRKSLVAGAVATMAVQPALAQDAPPTWLMSAGEYIVRSIIQTGVLAARSQMRITYDDILIDFRTGQVALTGLNVEPGEEMGAPPGCFLTAERVETSGYNDRDFGQARIDLTGVELAPDCLPPEPRAMAQSIGYERVRAEAVAIHYDFDVGSSALNVTMNAALENAAEIEAAASFAYFWFTTDEYGEPGEPIADLAFAEIALTDTGLLERAGPMLGAMIGDINAAPAMIEGGVLGAMSDFTGGQVTPEQTAFAADLRAAAEKFVAGEGKLVVALNPAEPVRVGPELMFDPAGAFATLSPQASSAVAATRALVGPQVLAAALSGGGGLSDEDRLAAGVALTSGVGAPYAPAQGRDVLGPLIEAWHPGAAIAAAESLANTPTGAEEAYRYALVAAAGGAPGAISMAERLEGRLSLAAIASAQSDLSDMWPGAGDADAAAIGAVQAGDLSALRAMARDAADGRGRPRDLADAYLMATLAAAGGDRGAAALRERLTRRYGARGGDDADVWAAIEAEVGAAAMAAWVDGGMAGALASD